MMEGRYSDSLKEKFLDEDLKQFRSFAVSGNINESFSLIGGMDIDEYLNIYLVDFGNKKIRVYTFYGQCITTLALDCMNSPFSIAIDNKSMRVVITNLGRGFALMMRCNGSGPNILTSKPHLLAWPSGLTIDESGETYIADCNNNRVAIFDENLRFRRDLTSQKLIKPRDVKIYQNKVYVSNSNKSFHLLVFSKSGALLNSFIPLDADGNLFLAVYPKNENIILSNSNRSEIVLYSPRGEMLQRGYTLSRPTGVVFTPSGDVIVGYYDCATVNFFNFN